MTDERPLLVAVAGNPNTGKTTLFNALTGGRAKTGNYPGVTVEQRIGAARSREFVSALGRSAEIVDVPGCYSLTASSPDEAVAVQVLAGRAGVDTPPDVVVVVADVTNLSRNLFLALQILELGSPVVLALTMNDLLAQAEGSVDVAGLEQRLGVPVVVSTRGDIDAHSALAEAVRRALELPQKSFGRKWRWPDPHQEEAIAAAATQLVDAELVQERHADGWAHWLLAERSAGPTQDEVCAYVFGDGDQRARQIADELAGDIGGDVDPTQRAIQLRYAWIDEIVGAAVDPGTDARRRSDRIDRVITHPIGGPAIFLGVMALIFQLMFAWSDPLIGAIEGVIGWMMQGTSSALGEGPLSALITEGIIAGVGNVLVFLPQIMILFALLAVLDASGYLARAAYIMDRVMARVGLHGRAFVPLLASFACAVPGIVATRTIADPKDRFVTILVAPLITCAARLPVYALLIAALFDADRRVAGVFTLGGLILLGLYLFGIVAALGVAWVLKRTLFKGPREPLILELPPYQVPRLRDVWSELRERTGIFLKDAGTIILACTIVLWAVLSYPESPELEAELDEAIAAHEELEPDVDLEPDAHVAWADEHRLIAQEYRMEIVEQSIAGRVGSVVQPVVEPLGFDLKITVGLIAAISAREVMVGALGVTYGVGDEVDEESPSLRRAIEEDPAMTPAVGVSLLIWFVFAFQCMSTLAVVKRETQSWRWPIFLVVYQTALAWVCAFAAYRIALAAGLA